MEDDFRKEVIAYYDEFYRREDFRYYSPSFTRRILSALCSRAGVKPGARVLDIGCGTGHYTAIFQAMGYDALGIDISRTAVERARELHPESRFAVEDATRLPFPKASFDLIFSLGVSVMSTPDLTSIHAYIRHLMEFVAPGGSLILIGGSDLSGRRSKTSSWLYHTWDEIRRFVPNGPWTTEGPYLTHFRFVAAVPSLSLSMLLTTILRFLPLKTVWKTVYLIRAQGHEKE
ncbi:MAG: methyltransferase domain-containing protein [Bacteroidota bacterium]|nr:methyltransferase domain-containing protein [Bacteroidota bacterium]